MVSLADDTQRKSVTFPNFASANKAAIIILYLIFKKTITKTFSFAISNSHFLQLNYQRESRNQTPNNTITLPYLGKLFPISNHQVQFNTAPYRSNYILYKLDNQCVSVLHNNITYFILKCSKYFFILLCIQDRTGHF